MEDAKYLNNVIPELITKSNQYTDEIRKRIKVHAIFNEFEEKANGDFKKYLTESYKKYKGVKSGTVLDHAVKNSHKYYQEIGEKILNDRFYTNLDLTKERERMREKTDKKKLKEVSDLIEKVRQATDLSSNLGNVLGTSVKLTETNPAEENPEPPPVIPREELIREGTKIVTEEIDKDHQRFINSMDGYQDYLDKLKTNLDNTEEIKKEYSTPKLKEGLKMLNFKKPVKPKVEKKVKEQYNINMKKILRYSKLGKLVHWEYYPEEEEEQKAQTGEENKCENTMSLVKSEAVAGFGYLEAFNKKRDALTKDLKDDDIPALEDYDDIIRQKEAQMRYNRNKNKRYGEDYLEPEDLLYRKLIEKRNEIQRNKNSIFVTSQNF